jgi:hypothetical protein
MREALVHILDALTGLETATRGLLEQVEMILARVERLERSAAARSLRLLPPRRPFIPAARACEDVEEGVAP